MHYAIDYVDQLMKKTMQFFTTDEDKPSLPTPPPPLASSYTPNKDTIPLFSRYILYIYYVYQLWSRRKILMACVLL